MKFMTISWYLLHSEYRPKRAAKLVVQSVAKDRWKNTCKKSHRLIRIQLLNFPSDLSCPHFPVTWLSIWTSKSALVIKLHLSTSLASHRLLLWVGLKASSLQYSTLPSAAWNLPCKGFTQRSFPSFPRAIFVHWAMHFPSKKDLYKRRLVQDFSLALKKFGILISPGKAGLLIPWTF